MAELNKMAQNHFERLGIDRLYATVDGQMFILKDRAELHAGSGTVFELEAKPIATTETVEISQRETQEENPGTEQAAKTAKKSTRTINKK